MSTGGLRSVLFFRAIVHYALVEFMNAVVTDQFSHTNFLMLPNNISYSLFLWNELMMHKTIIFLLSGFDVFSSGIHSASVLHSGNRWLFAYQTYRPSRRCFVTSYGEFCTYRKPVVLTKEVHPLDISINRHKLAYERSSSLSVSFSPKISLTVACGILSRVEHWKQKPEKCL